MHFDTYFAVASAELRDPPHAYQKNKKQYILLNTIKGIIKSVIYLSSFIRQEAHNAITINTIATIPKTSAIILKIGIIRLAGHWLKYSPPTISWTKEMGKPQTPIRIPITRKDSSWLWFVYMMWNENCCLSKKKQNTNQLTRS